jgi:tetratricopeptide (TPR) repeat protein
MQMAAPATVLGNFEQAQFTYNGVSSTFYRKEGRYLVRTDAADGSLQEFEISYTFGYYPLQQYLVQFPDGRYQALGIAWDSRSAAEGGQRWFHLYPDQNVDHKDWLHWTRPSQNWNHQCADCHSTDLQKHYVEKTNRFATSWAEINVACEACHGPGSQHIAWEEQQQRYGESANQVDTPANMPDNRGLVRPLGDVDNGKWVLAEGKTTAERIPPRANNTEVETCAPCHSRRLTVHQPAPGDAYLDNYRFALLTPSLYHPDGQVLDEVYVYGSFLQSRMHHAGVICSDCHDPHSLRIGSSGDSACNNCHQPNHFGSPQHHHHKLGSAGASCVECHMPETTYMVVDPRRDHSIRVPRPDLSVQLGVPNACNRCHQDKSAQWAADAAKDWYGPELAQKPHYGKTMAAAFADSLDAERQLLVLINDAELPPIVRASALMELGNHLGEASLPTLRQMLRSSEPLLRYAAVQAAESIPPQPRVPYLLPLLADPIRLVRTEAAVRLAGATLPTAAQELLNNALQEYLATQQFNADRSEAHLNIGVLALRLGALGDAEAAYHRALTLSPDDAAILVNLADLYRELDREEDCAATLQEALTLEPDNADILHALGLQEIRVKQMDAALGHLQRAAELSPEQTRYAYVYGVALCSLGQEQEGIVALEKAHRLHPADQDLLLALLNYLNKPGTQERAQVYADKLYRLSPNDSGMREYLQGLGFQESGRHETAAPSSGE